MRYSNIITYIILAVTLLQGCNKSIEIDRELDHATLQIGIVTRAASSKATNAINNNLDGLLGEAEYAIKSLRIFAFDVNGRIDTVDFIEYSTPIASSVFHRFEVTKAKEKLLYVIVNEPEGLFDNVENITTTEDLEDINYTIASKMNGGFNAASKFEHSDFVIPMTAIKTIDASGNRDVTIGVDRAVARVDLMLDKSPSSEDNIIKLTSSTVFQVNGVTINSNLFEGDNLPNVSKSDIEQPFATISSEIEIPTEVSDNSSAQRVLSFYLAERTYDKDDADTQISIKVDRLQIDGSSVDIKNTIVLGALETTPLTEIKRNKIYRIYATYTGVKQELVPTQFAVVDWEYKELNGDIEGVLLAVDNELAMDWLRNGNSFTAPEASFGSNKPIEVYLPVTTGSGDNIGYEFEKYEFENVSAGASYDLKTLPLNNNFILETKWIDEAKLVFTSEKTGYIKVTYKTINTKYNLQTYPIRFKSDNVVKQISVIYDNGYIPSEFLPSHWQERAPGGVIFAKRGYLKNPRTDVNVYLRDEDGYYRGDHKLTAAKADEYCKALGDMWYLPSQEDMEAMIPGVKELGTSYRFQDTGSDFGAATPALYWTSTESTATPNYYWCGNFILNNNPIDDVYDWMEERSGDESNFVRCVLDLK